MTYDERVRLSERLAELEASDRRFQAELENVVRDVIAGMRIAKPKGMNDVCARARRVLEVFLLSRGERFVKAIKNAEMHALGLSDLSAIVIDDVSKTGDKSGLKAALPTVIAESVRTLLIEPTDATQHCLRLLSDAYTLFAFLRETPDVQGALVKLFSHGQIWLDTTIVLPVFVESLLEPSSQRFRNMLLAARECGQELYMTKGVLEEVQTHIERSIHCWRTKASEWHGSVPYVYSGYIRAGRPAAEFGRWIEEFYGTARPADDIADYLNDVFGVEMGSLEREAASMPSDLRAAVQEIWHEAHERRRKRPGAAELDAITLKRLVDHDVENYLGVVARRETEERSEVGYGAWWLTLDRVAFDVQHEVRSRVDRRVPACPVMAPDFLVNYLAFGPVRRLVSKGTEQNLPLVLDLEITEFLPPELIEVAERVRAESAGLNDRLMRRRIRDGVDAAKRRRGPVTEAGLTLAGNEQAGGASRRPER